MPEHERERLTEAEYEEYYSEALRILHYRYEFVGLPYRNEKRDRICRIESLHADDRTVFLLAFGSEVAQEIKQDKPVYIRSHSATS